MTVKDALLRLKTLTTTPVTITEEGWTTLTRNDPTGQIVVQIDKCPEGGIPIEVKASADTGTPGGGGTHVVTIEASDTLAEEGYIVVATFPTLTQVAAKQVATRMVRRIATQKKYIRSVITSVAGDMSRFYEISVGVGMLDDDSTY